MWWPQLYQLLVKLIEYLYSKNILQCLHALSHIILILPKSYYYPCFTDEKIKLEVD